MESSKLVLGLIGGSGLLKSTMIQEIAKKELVVETKFGKVKVRRGALSDKIDLVFVQRHAASTEVEYSPPHLINYPAIMQSLNDLNCSAVVAVCSVGSLKSHIPIGSLVVPDDYFSPMRIISAFDDHQGHTVPEIHGDLRQEILNALFNAELRPLDGGVYVNASGPRFETKSEIRFLSNYGDIIGMTGAHEACIAKELSLPYAMLTTIDNMANGIGDTLTVSKFYQAQATNKATVENAVHLMLNHFKRFPEILFWLNMKENAITSEEEELKKAKVENDVNLVIHAQYVVTVNADDQVLQGHAVAIRNEKIVEILPSSDADSKYGPFTTANLEVVRLPDCVLMPGLVNAHTHAPMVFMRGFGDDLKLDTWLTQKIWPAEVRCVSSEFCAQGTELACAEMIYGGTTCFNDMYFFSESIANVVDKVGMRAFVGCTLIEFPSAYANNAEEYMAKGRLMIQQHRDEKKTERVSFCVSPHSTYAVNEDHIVEAYEMAKEFKIPFHIHLHETEREVEDSVEGNRESQFCHNCAKNCRPLKNLLDLNIVDESFVAAHMVHLTDQEIEILAEKKANIVHCPTSNMKLASGFCQVKKLLNAGVNVALGTDGAASNNTLDMFAEMKLAAILAKGVASDPEAVPAKTVLRMGTINGAKALGIADRVGSIEVGKHADIIAVDMNDIPSMPMYDPVSHLVYSTGRHQVMDVWVDGKPLLRNRKLTTIDAGKMRRNAEHWQREVIKVDQSHDGTYK